MAFPQGSIPGIDVSHEQGAVDWAAVASGGEVFAYAKATEGITWTDIYFHDNWQGMKTAGLLRGAYHYFLPADDPGAQATNFLNLLTKANGSATLAPGNLPAMLDLEVTQGVSTATILTNVQSWMNQVQAETGRLPLLYTNPNFWKNMLGNPTDLAQYPLWIARYGVASPGTFGG